MRITILLILIPLLAPSLARAEEQTAAEKQIRRGDRYWSKREKGRKWVEKSKECFEKALAHDTKSVAASWRLGRAAWWLGDHSESRKVKLRLFRQAVNITKRGIALDDESVESHFWLGLSYAKFGEAKGILSSLQLLGPVRREMRRVIELDEAFAGGGARRALGWIYYQLPAIAGGSDRKAIAELKRAVELDKTHLLNHLFLAVIYEETGEEKLALRHLKTILEAPLDWGRRPEEIEIKAKAKELVEEMDEAK